MGHNGSVHVLVASLLLLGFAPACSDVGTGEANGDDGVTQVSQAFSPPSRSANPGVYGRGSGLLWRDPNGDLRVWDMQGSATFNASFVHEAGQEWEVIGTGDFNRDRSGDVLWRNRDDILSIWYLDAERFLSATSARFPILAPRFDSGPGVPFFGDLDGDGDTDIIWTGSTGPGPSFKNVTWYMEPDSAAPQTEVISAPGVDRVIAVGNFDGDFAGGADVMYRAEGSDGMVRVSANGGLNVTSLLSIPLEWTIKGVGDFNRDLTSDVLWYNTQTGGLAIWFMSLGSILSSMSPGAVAPSSGWSIQGIGDFDHDGVSDIAWRHSSGVVSIWVMNATGNPMLFGAGLSVDPNVRFSGVAELGAGIGVWLWSDANFTGKLGVFSGIESDPAPPFFSVQDNSASSLQLGRNMEARLFRSTNFIGFGETFQGSQATLVGTPLGNDTMSSISVQPKDGVQVETVQGDAGCASFLGIGTYPTQDFLTRTDNRIFCDCTAGCPVHRVKTSDDVVAQVCREPYFGGDCRLVDGPTAFDGFTNPANGQLLPIGSMRVIAKPLVWLFTDWHFNGSRVVKGEGAYSGSGLGIPDNSLSSIRIGKGAVVRVCRDNNFGDFCQNLTDDEVDFRNVAVGNDTVSSIQVMIR